MKKWITINEPWVVAVSGHATGEFAPGIRDPESKVYEVAHNLIRAHAKAYRLYHREFAVAQSGNLAVSCLFTFRASKQTAD